MQTAHARVGMLQTLKNVFRNEGRDPGGMSHDRVFRIV